MLLRRTTIVTPTSENSCVELKEEEEKSAKVLTIHLGGAMALTLEPVPSSPQEDNESKVSSPKKTPNPSQSSSVPPKVVKIVHGSLPTHNALREMVLSSPGTASNGEASARCRPTKRTGPTSFFPLIFQRSKQYDGKKDKKDHQQVCSSCPTSSPLGGCPGENFTQLTVEVVAHQETLEVPTLRGKDGSIIDPLCAEPESSRWQSHSVQQMKQTGAASKCCNFNHTQFATGDQRVEGFEPVHGRVLVMMLREHFEKDELDEMSREAQAGNHERFDSFVRDYIPYIYSSYQRNRRN